MKTVFRAELIHATGGFALFTAFSACAIYAAHPRFARSAPGALVFVTFFIGAFFANREDELQKVIDRFGIDFGCALVGVF